MWDDLYYLHHIPSGKFCNWNSKSNLLHVTNLQSPAYQNSSIEPFSVFCSHKTFNWEGDCSIIWRCSMCVCVVIVDVRIKRPVDPVHYIQPWGLLNQVITSIICISFSINSEISKCDWKLAGDQFLFCTLLRFCCYCIINLLIRTLENRDTSTIGNGPKVINCM